MHGSGEPILDVEEIGSMATTEANGIRLYYEEHGEGEPLLLIMGWGGNAASWQPQLPGLAEHFRVIAFDNRGAGRSSAPDEPYTIAQMAEDTAALLDTLEVPRAHVFGISMGGMIAQELALRHPERVNALILGCTSAGGRRAAGFAGLRREIRAFRERNGQGPDLEWFAEFMKTLWTDEALARQLPPVQDFVLSLIRHAPPLHGLKHQAGAIAEHDTHDRLPQIRHRTLVMTGERDTLVHPWNSHILANRIPNAKLHVFPGLRHAFHLERADAVNARIIDFIHRPN